MVEFLTQRQLDRLRSLAKAPRDWILIETQYETGCSVSELVNIKREHISDHILIAGRKCVISKLLQQKISAFLKTHSSQFLFPSREKPNMSPKRVQQIIRSYVKQLHLPIKKTSPHLLRYTHVAHAIEKNIPFKAIMTHTGLGELRLSQIAAEVTSKQKDDYGRMFQ